MWTQTLIGAAGMVAVGAITPGPNNFAVMAVAARAGFFGAVPAITGIVLGAAALLILVATGTGSVLAAEPRVLTMLSAGGSLYLTYLGGRLIADSFAGRGEPSDADVRVYPSGTIGLFAFQFVNPKAWVLTLTVVSAAQIDAEIGVTILPLLTIFVVIPAISLALWSSFGVAMSKLLSRRSAQAWFDRAMGSLLIVCASVLLVEGTGLAR